MKNKVRLLLLFLAFVLVITVSRCYYDSEEYLFPEYNQVCDTTDATYSGAVSGILDQYCLTCHSNANATAIGGNLRLETYDDVKVRVDDGSLRGAINHDPGYSAMPKNASKLNNCKLTVIQKWIDGGALNN